MTHEPSNAEHDIDYVVEIDGLPRWSRLLYEAARVNAAKRLASGATTALDLESATGSAACLDSKPTRTTTARAAR